MGLEYLLCAFGCGMLTMYIPETRTDAFGIEGETLCCCCEGDQKFCMLPRDPAGYEILVLRAGQIKCITPPISRGGPLVKGVLRSFFVNTKCAIPCDDEVPFALAFGGVKCAEKVPSGKIMWCTDNTPVDPTTGKKPMFPALAKHEKPSGEVLVPTVEVPVGTPVTSEMDRP